MTVKLYTPIVWILLSEFIKFAAWNAYTNWVSWICMTIRYCFLTVLQCTAYLYLAVLFIYQFWTVRYSCKVQVDLDLLPPDNKFTKWGRVFVNVILILYASSRRGWLFSKLSDGLKTCNIVYFQSKYCNQVDCRWKNMTLKSFFSILFLFLFEAWYS